MHKININLKNLVQINIIRILFSIIITIIIISELYLSTRLLNNIGIEKNNMFILISIIIIIITLSEICYYNIKIDPYVINIELYSFIFFSRKIDFIDISHDMLEDYSVFNKPLSLNKILMLKIKDNNNSIISKRFNLTLISSKEINIISKALDKIVANNNS